MWTGRDEWFASFTPEVVYVGDRRAVTLRRIFQRTVKPNLSSYHLAVVTWYYRTEIKSKVFVKSVAAIPVKRRRDET